MGKEYKASKRYPGVRQVAGAATWSYRFKIKVNGETLEGGKSGFNSAQEAFEERAKAIEDAKSRGYVADSGKKFRDVFEEWVKSQEGVKSEGTLKRHRSIFKNHLEPMFGDRYIITISGQELDDYLNNLGKPTTEKKFGKPHQYASEYIDGFYKTLFAIFSYAMRNGYVKVNRVLEVEKNRHRGVERRKGVRIPDEMLTKLDERFQSTNLHPAFYIGFNAGLRISEIFGLLWDDIDFDKRRLHVNKQLIYVDHCWELSKPKTEEANREVVMNENLTIYLSMLKQKQQQQAKELGEAYRNHEKVRITKANGEITYISGLPFVNRKLNGEFLTPDSGKILQRIARDDLNYRFRWHDLRHTFATILANENDANINFLRAQLGHKKIESVMHYYTQVSEKVLEQGRVVINKLNIADSSAYEPQGIQDYDVMDAEELEAIDNAQIGKELENKNKIKFRNGLMISD